MDVLTVRYLHMINSLTMDIPLIDESTCLHCGSKCEEEAVTDNNNHFCCNGCKLVYEMINEYELEYYYSIEQNAGNKALPYGEYEFLDDPVTANRFIKYQDDKIAKIELYIPSIHCAACVWLLEKLYKILPGTFNIRVNFIKQTL